MFEINIFDEKIPTLRLSQHSELVKKFVVCVSCIPFARRDDQVTRLHAVPPLQGVGFNQEILEISTLR